MTTTRTTLGPFHLEAFGPVELVVGLDGGAVVKVEPHVGFLHRGVEKLAESRSYTQNIPCIERLDYTSPLAYSDAYVAALEKADGIEVAKNAVYCRVILLELQRIASHLLWLGMTSKFLGASELRSEALGMREIICGLLGEVSGSPVFHSAIRPGGLRKDFRPGFRERVLASLGGLEGSLRMFEAFMSRDSLFKERTRGIGILSGAQAVALGVAGPVLRASGVSFDVRKDAPYYAYAELGFAPQTLKGGDCFARCMVRMLEVEESVRLIKAAFQKMPAGNAVGTDKRLVFPNSGKSVRVARETPRGECVIHFVPGPKGPHRLAIRTPSFANLSAIDSIARGCKLSDLRMVLASLDVAMGDVDK